MTNEMPQHENISDEFQELGRNLVNVMKAAWESPERKRLQQEIENGLQELETTIKRETENFSSSPTGQQLKVDVDKFSQKISDSETPETIRKELIKALQMANYELQKMISRFASDETESADPTQTNSEEGPE